ncbi:YhcH/YjgK/YiaL family protein [Psychromonas sp. MME2]|uniref:YhcH/YjgK/YiaL family protein n=1 Tax=unclassified Psychromonas TaxID=2614957 RepID=UPI00339CE648
MLFGNVQKLSMLSYASNELVALIKEALALVEGKSDGKYPLSAANAFVIVAHGETELREQRRSEIHKAYIDVQVVLQGSEAIGYSYSLDENSAALTSLENDVTFFDDVENEQFVNLYAGDFAIFYPNQLHRPLCAIDKPEKVKKAIIKIPKVLFD